MKRSAATASAPASSATRSFACFEKSERPISNTVTRLCARTTSARVRWKMMNERRSALLFILRPPLWLLDVILLRVDGLPAPFAVREHVREDRPVNVLPALVARHDDAVDYADVAIDARVQILESLFQTGGRLVLRRVEDVLRFVEEVAGRDGMDEVGREYAFERRGVVLVPQPLVLKRDERAAVV